VKRDPVKNTSGSRPMTPEMAAAIRARLTTCRDCGRELPSLRRVVCPPCRAPFDATQGAR
jgi:predicted amidophosphoribosyltransferase